MDRKLQRIRHKITDIQLGLLRFTESGKRVALQVKATGSINLSSSVDCIVIEGGHSINILNKDVNLVQRSRNDYLYLKGRISGEALKGTRVLSIDIHKACWFIRKTKGNISWLQEACIYENISQAI
jgi:hypothetical protein